MIASVRCSQVHNSWQLSFSRLASGKPRFRVCHWLPNGASQSWLFPCPLQAWAFFSVASRAWRSPLGIPQKRKFRAARANAEVEIKLALFFGY